MDGQQTKRIRLVVIIEARAERVRRETAARRMKTGAELSTAFAGSGRE